MLIFQVEIRKVVKMRLNLELQVVIWQEYIFVSIYLIQLIEHPILRIPNIFFVYILSIFSR